MNTAPFVIERTLNAPVERIWKAITDPTEMKQWYFDLPTFRPEVGCEFRFEGGPPEKCYLHICEVTEVVENKRLTYSWRYDGYPGLSFVTFELFGEGDKTRLVLTHSDIESFGTENPDLAKTNFIAGWTHIIGTSLIDYINKENK